MIRCRRSQFKEAAGRPVGWAAAVGCLLGGLLLGLTGCGRPDPANRPRPLAQITDFDTLFDQHCTGCHGKDGKLGPAPPLNDALFLAIIPEEAFQDVVHHGRRGTPMPAMVGRQWYSLSDEQARIVITGIRSRWGPTNPQAFAGAPPYSIAAARQGGSSPDAAEGKKLFEQICTRCHGAGKRAGPLDSPAFLALASDQLLRRTIITGRPDLGMPDYRRLGTRRPSQQPLNSHEISDLVAHLVSWRHPVLQTGSRAQPSGKEKP